MRSRVDEGIGGTLAPCVVVEGAAMTCDVPRCGCRLVVALDWRGQVGRGIE